jgi:murein DD-endopeptidase MepM/ murein hydrolase activator NlpD
MYCAVALIRPLGRAVCLGIVSAGLAACSAESTRFSDNAYGPRNSANESTGSIAPAPAPTNHVEARPLAQAAAAPATAPAAPTYVAGGGRGMASYNPDSDSRGPAPALSSYSASPTPVAYNPPPAATPPRAAPAPEVTGSVAAHKPAVGGRWSWDGGTAVTVAPGETVESIAHRHGVPVAAVMEANNLASPRAIQAGQRLVIPRYIPPLTGSNTVAVLPAHAAPAVKPTTAPPHAEPAPATAAIPAGRSAAPASSEVHVVAAGDTLSKIARQYGKPVPEIARANNIQPNAKLSVGDRILIPGGHTSHAKTEGEPASAVAAKPENKEVAAVVTPSTEASNPVVSSKPAAESAPSLRWPVHGRVIAAFGSKSNGQANDGIDVAVPENTPVKAADDGVVAYAGNELKGYGNLVLVRHPSGYVTAYAHAKELLVKKGDPIKRGQVIAKSGQTGNVEVPELHFEVRKGTAPIDPMQFLGGA